MINIQMERERKPKSIKLAKDEMQTLKKYVNAHHTIIDAAYAIGIHRNVLDMVLIRGTGSPETVDKIREKLASITA